MLRSNAKRGDIVKVTFINSEQGGFEAQERINRMEVRLVPPFPTAGLKVQVRAIRQSRSTHTSFSPIVSRPRCHRTRGRRRGRTQPQDLASQPHYLLRSLVSQKSSLVPQSKRSLADVLRLVSLRTSGRAFSAKRLQMLSLHVRH